MIDAEISERRELAEDEPIGFTDGVREERAQEDPFAEAHQRARGRLVPARAGVVPAQDQVRERHVHESSREAAGDQRPDARRDQRPDHHHGQRGDLSDDLDQGGTPELEVALRGEVLDGLQARENRRKARDRNQQRQLVVPVEVGHGQREGRSDQKQRDAAEELDGPRRVEKHGIIPAFVLDDARGNAQIRKQIDGGAKGMDDGHHPERFGRQHAREHDLSAHAQPLYRRVPGEDVGAAADGATGRALRRRIDLRRARFTRDRRGRESDR